jgi:hypothetical protein
MSTPDIALPPLRTFLVRAVTPVSVVREVIIEAHTLNIEQGCLTFACYVVIELGGTPQVVLYTRRGFHDWVDFEEVMIGKTPKSVN